MRMAAFDIADNGMGIDPEKQYLLFKPFSQVSVCLRLKCMHACLSVCLHVCLSVSVGAFSQPNWVGRLSGVENVSGVDHSLDWMASRG